MLRHRFLASHKFEFKKHVLARRAQCLVLPFNPFLSSELRLEKETRSSYRSAQNHKPLTKFKAVFPIFKNSQASAPKKMASTVPHSVADDRDLDDADLWAVIDSAVATHSASKSRKSLAIRSPNFQSLSPISNPSPPSKLSKYPKTPNSNHSDTKSRVSVQGEVIQEPCVYRPPRKLARTCPSEASETSPLIVLKNVQRTPTTPVYSSPEAHLLPEIGKFSVKEISASSEVSFGSFGRSEEKQMVHSLSGRFPSVSLFKEYQNTAMAVIYFDLSFKIIFYVIYWMNLILLV